MTMRALTAALVAFVPATASAVPLAAHQAVYDLELASQDAGIVGAEGRIAMSVKSKACEAWDLDYRFVARFQQAEEMTLTDQQTTSTESRNGSAFTFATKTFVDGSPEKEVRGEAHHEPAGTKVAMESPEKKSFVLPLSRFPMQHTADLIQRAEAGERVFETKLFDGDDDAEKLLTSTAVITPIEAGEKAAKPIVKTALAPDIGAKLAGMKSWRISESYYNSDSDDDGMPVFQTKYVLYENGVSDDLTLDFGTYAFTGTLKKLDILDAPACP